MVKQRAVSKGSSSGAIGAGTGLAASILLSIVLTAVLTSLITKGTVSERAVGVSVFFVRLLAVFTGSLIGAATAHEKYLKVSGIIVVGYLFALFGLGIVLYDGTFRNLWSGVVSALLGGILAILIKLRPQRKGKIARHYIK